MGLWGPGLPCLALQLPPALVGVQPGQKEAALIPNSLKMLIFPLTWVIVCYFHSDGSCGL